MKTTFWTSLGSLAILVCVLPCPSLCAPAPALSLDQALEKLKSYEEGQNNQALVVIEQFVGRASGEASQRQRAADRLAALLAEEQTSPAAKLFICQQLRLVGGEAQVPLLSRMLDEAKTADMARLTLQALPCDAASRALIEALGRTKGATLVGCINSLGERRDKLAVGPLARLIQGPDKEAASAAAQALAKIGTVAAAEALAGAGSAAASSPGLAEAQLVCAQRLVQNGQTAQAQAIYRKLGAPTYTLTVRLAALVGLAQAAPGEALPALVAALNSNEPQLQGLAADLARRLPGENVTTALSREADKLNGLPRLLLLGALVERGDRTALSRLSPLTSDAALGAEAPRELRRLRHATRDAALQEQLQSVVKDTGTMATILSPAPYGQDVIEQRRKEVAAALAPGDALLCYLDCGVEGQAQGASGVGLRQVNGASYQFPDSEKTAAPPLGTVAHNGSDLQFEVTGLDPQKKCALGFSWWDYDSGGRAQTISFSGGGAGPRVPALPSTRLPTYTSGRKTAAVGSLPIDSSLIKAGKLRVAFARQSGPNAVASEIWVVQTKAGSPAATQATLSGAALAAPPPAKPVNLDPPPEGTKVLLVTGNDYPGHPWQQTAPVLKKLLEQDERLKVRIVEDPNALASPKLKEWDVVIIHFMDWEVPGPGPDARENLRQFVAGGKGLVLTHFACGAWDNNEWPEFRTLAGRVWDPKLRAHDPHGTFTVEIADPDHPITRGMKSFETLDELYTCLAGEAPIHVVAKARSKVDGKDYPMGFVLNYGKGRVFHSPLGHDARAYASPGVGELLRRGCAWAAALSPTRETSAVRPAGAFRWADVNDKSLGLWDGDKPVLVYNHGVLLKDGVPADRARSSYVHPLYGLDGEVLTDDFPKDHYHHRGLFWSWPHVQIGGKHFDLWMLKGIEHRVERWLEKGDAPTAAVLGVENGWYVGREKVMREEVRFRVQPAAASGRALDLDFTWVPLGQPITLTGAEGKSYGGLTLRYAPGTNTAIIIPAGLTDKDLPMTNLPWADLTRLWAKEQITSGAALFVHPSHPDFPPQWLTRHYGVLCLGWPGVKPATFQPGEAVRCSYRVWIHRGPASPTRLAEAYEAYKAAVRAP